MKLTRLPGVTTLSLLAAATTVAALQVAPGSPCAHLCLASGSDNNWSADASFTNSSEITCSDSAYSDTKVGIKYKQCQDCLRTSSRGNWGETDAKWFVYNLRYALDVCLFDSPKAVNSGPVSPCASNKSCKNLKDSLTGDDLAPTQNGTWDYCFADNGAFMGSDRATCMQCLRDTQDQTYMANFLTALEAGCRQTPEKGTAIGLSGTVFTRSAVNITDPETPPAEEHGSLSTGAIIGIAVGVIVLIVVAVGLLLFYCHKQKVEDNWEDYYYDAYAPPRQPRQPYPRGTASQKSPQQSLPSNPRAMHEPPRAMYIRSNPRYPEDEKPKAFISSGDYYDSIEKGLRESRSAPSYPMEELNHTAARSTGTLHTDFSACTDRAVSRGRSRNPVDTSDISLPASLHRPTDREASPPASVRREPSPPAVVHKRVRPNTPDSYIEQVYLDAAAQSARMAAANAVAHASSPTASSATSPGSTKRRSMLSMLSLPRKGSVKKDDMPAHKYVLQPPITTNDKAFHGDKNISRPILATQERRFLDANTISSRVPVISNAPRPPTPDDAVIQYSEVPLKSGKSALYGM